ncbi:MAG: hypothetical protein M1826_001726 [Phylliscum demangeonii]|nr:MAG: hypothetical protein M1826_001726 [Phylliscum demangeonii]
MAVATTALMTVEHAGAAALTSLKHRAEPPPVERDGLSGVIVTPCNPWSGPFHVEGGLRRVKPYYFTYNTHCKERWRGRGLLDIFVDEFRDRSPEYYEEAIKSGLIVVNGKPVFLPTTPIKNGDLISHTLHRHEPPVTSEPITIVYEDDDLLVVNKPAGVPVHPTGRYNFNSVIEILRADRRLGWNPLPCNRLDRLTSGILLIGKHPTATTKMCQSIVNRDVRKEYIARVRGEFPEHQVECAEPILLISPKLGLNRVRANGKEARTVFQRLAYFPPIQAPATSRNQPETLPPPLQPSTLDPSVSPSPSPHPTGTTPSAPASMEPSAPSSSLGYSIVRCLPITGRTHQIRVHLQFLGHPISNDPIYSNRRVFGASLGFLDSSGATATDEDIISRLARMGKDEVADALAYHDEIVSQYDRTVAEKMTGADCEICQTPLYSDPGPHELGIYLHARSYACTVQGWAFETPLPAWAALPPDVTRDGGA